MIEYIDYKSYIYYTTKKYMIVDVIYLVVIHIIINHFFINPSDAMLYIL